MKNAYTFSKVLKGTYRKCGGVLVDNSPQKNQENTQQYATHSCGLRGRDPSLLGQYI